VGNGGFEGSHSALVITDRKHFACSEFWFGPVLSL